MTAGWIVDIACMGLTTSLRDSALMDSHILSLTQTPYAGAAYMRRVKIHVDTYYMLGEILFIQLTGADRAMHNSQQS